MTRSYFAVIYPRPGTSLFGGAPYLVSSRFETRAMAQDWANGYLEMPNVARQEIRPSKRLPQIVRSPQADRKSLAAGKDD